jgi:hypothetical protein
VLREAAAWHAYQIADHTVKFHLIGTNRANPLIAKDEQKKRALTKIESHATGKQNIQNKKPIHTHMSPRRTNADHNNIFHKNREISILTMKKKTARLTLLQEATERTSQGEIQNKTRKTHSGMNESASLTPVQGPSTVACMIVT